MSKGASLALTVVALGFVTAVCIYFGNGAKKNGDKVQSQAISAAAGIWSDVGVTD